jgi:hypothetical protein
LPVADRQTAAAHVTAAPPNPSIDAAHQRHQARHAELAHAGPLEASRDISRIDQFDTAIKQTPFEAFEQASKTSLGRLHGRTATCTVACSWHRRCASCSCGTLMLHRHVTSPTESAAAALLAVMRMAASHIASHAAACNGLPLPPALIVMRHECIAGTITDTADMLSRDRSRASDTHARLTASRWLHTAAIRFGCVAEHSGAS